MRPRPFLLLIVGFALALMAGDADAQSNDRDDGIYVLDKETGNLTAIDNPNPTSVEVGCDEEPTEDQLSESNLAGLLNEHGKILIQDGNDTYYMARCGNGTRQQHNCYDPGGRTASDNATDPWLDILDDLFLSNSTTAGGEYTIQLLREHGTTFPGGNGSGETEAYTIIVYKGVGSNGSILLFAYEYRQGIADNGSQLFQGITIDMEKFVQTSIAGDNGSGGGVVMSHWIWTGSVGGNGNSSFEFQEITILHYNPGMSTGGNVSTNGVAMTVIRKINAAGGDNDTPPADFRLFSWMSSAGGNGTGGAYWINADGSKILLSIAGGGPQGQGVISAVVLSYDNGSDVMQQDDSFILHTRVSLGGANDGEWIVFLGRCRSLDGVYAGIGDPTTAYICIPQNTFAASGNITPTGMQGHFGVWWPGGGGGIVGGNGTLSPQFDCMASCVILSAMFTGNGTVTQANIIKQEACTAPDITEEVDSGNEDAEDPSDDDILVSAGGVDVMKRDAVVAGVGATATLTLSAVGRRILSRGTDPLLRKRP